MAEKYSSKDGRHARPPSRIMYKPQRSVSTGNEMKREPVCQPILRRERKLSAISNGEVTQAVQRRSRVAQLIEKFENFNPTDNDVSSTSSKTSPSLVTSNITVSTSLDKTLTPPITQKKITITTTSKLIPTLHQSRLSPEARIETSIPNTSDSISNNSNDQTIENTHVPDDLPNSIPRSSLSSEEPLTSEPTGVIFRRSNNLSTLTNSDDDSSDSSSMVEDEGLNINKETNFFKPHEEVYDTERTYVKKLHVLSYKLYAQVKETCEKDKNLIKTFKVVYKPLQETLKALYKFHYGVILSHIEQYKTNHRTDNMWSIFQQHFQTIEDLYTAYYVAYDENQRKLERLCRIYPLIDKAMLKCQEYLENLYPIAELNCANQRLLRYILLIKSYMKHLDENSPEYEHTCFIHDELNRIASRCEDQLAVSPSQVKKLKARFDNQPECFENQQLIWHGLLKKQSPRRRTRIAQSYVILLSDCILVCEESGNKLEMKRQLLIKSLTVDVIEGRRLAPTTINSTYGQQFNVLTYFPFRVNAIEKSYEFLVDKEQDREKWMNKIRQAKENFNRRNSDVEVRQSCHRSNEDPFGIRAPTWVNDTDVTRCQICNDRFGLISDRHHCRSCGRCVCGSCSTKKLILKYCYDKDEVRVCDTCYTHFTGITKQPISSTKIARNPDKTILFGDFLCVPSNSTVWIDLQEDHHLHIYGAKLDQVEDFSINLTELREISFIEKPRTFVLNMKDKIYKFTIELTHQIIFQENNYINDTIKNTNNKSIFYANLWHDAMQLARSKTVPLWYTRKRVSADSGIIGV